MPLSQVPQILLSCARRHGTKFIGLVGRVLGVDDFAQQEVSEHCGLGKRNTLRDWWAKGRNVLGTSYSHTAERVLV